MKRFLIKLFTAGFVVIGLLLSLWMGLTCSERKNYERSIGLSDGKNVICNSDSMTVYGLNPAAWPELANISGEGAPFDVQLMKLKDVIEANPNKIKTVLLDVSILSVAVGKIKPTVNKGTYAGKYYLLYVWHRKDNNPLYATVNNEPEVALDWLKFKIKKVLHRDCSSVIAQGYIRKDVSFIGRGEREQQGEASYAQWVNGCVMEGKSWAISCIREMLRLCQKNNIDVYIIHMPLHHGITDRFDSGILQRFYETMDCLAREYHASHLSLLNDEELEDGDFIDSNHLNWRGSMKITKKLKEIVQKQVD